MIFHCAENQRNKKMSKENKFSDEKSSKKESVPKKIEYTKMDRLMYFNHLEAWLREAYAWQGVIAMLPHYLASSQTLNHTTGIRFDKRNYFKTILD